MEALLPIASNLTFMAVDLTGNWSGHLLTALRKNEFDGHWANNFYRDKDKIINFLCSQHVFARSCDCSRYLSISSVLTTLILI